MKIGIVAGEESGDQLGAGLIRALKELSARSDRPGLKDLQFSGLGGRRMLAEGFHSIDAMEILSVMGIVEPLKRLPSLLKLRKNLLHHFLSSGVDIVIGIDSPDFNLGLERRLRQRGIATCHYVCPSVWAWRQGRVKKIQASADHVLTLLPFEQSFLERAGIASTFVGHPVADHLQQLADKTADLAQHPASGSGKSAGSRICLMPGSRVSELDRLLETFLHTALICKREVPDLAFEIPAANHTILELIRTVLSRPEYAELKTVTTLSSESAHTVMQRSDIILLASGTASLEAGLLAKPMVVAYRLSPLTHAVARRLVKVDHISLPNLLLGERVVPEYVQSEASPQALAKALKRMVERPEETAKLVGKLRALMPMLALGADEKAAETVLTLCGENLKRRQAGANG